MFLCSESEQVRFSSSYVALFHPPFLFDCFHFPSFSVAGAVEKKIYQFAWSRGVCSGIENFLSLHESKTERKGWGPVLGY